MGFGKELTKRNMDIHIPFIEKYRQMWYNTIYNWESISF